MLTHTENMQTDLKMGSFGSWNNAFMNMCLRVFRERVYSGGCVLPFGTCMLIIQETWLEVRKSAGASSPRGMQWESVAVPLSFHSFIYSFIHSWVQQILTKIPSLAFSGSLAIRDLSGTDLFAKEVMAALKWVLRGRARVPLHQGREKEGNRYSQKRFLCHMADSSD